MQITINTPKMPDALKRAWNENPLAVIGTGALAATAISKVLDARSAAKGRRAYARQVDYRVKNKR